VAVSIVGEAAVRLRPNVEGFEGEAEDGILGPLTGTAKKAAGLFAAAFAAEKVGEFLKDSVMQASDLSESASKVGVVFGANSQQVLDFGTVAAHTLGISNQQALEATGTFGNLFRAIGLTTGTSADMSTKLVGLAGDLASFNNLDPTDVLDKLRSGLVGETEPLRDLGININDAALKQKALQLGLDASGPTLSAATKAQAAYALILEQTSLAQGDFSRTGGGLANQTRIISAEFADVKSNVGAGFLPFVLLGAHAITGFLMPALLTGTSYMRDFGDAVSSAGGYFSAGLNDADVTGLATATSKLGESFQMLMLNAGTAANVVQGEWFTFTDAVKGGGEGVLATEPSLAGFLSRFGTGLHGVGENASSAFMAVRTSAVDALTPLASQLAPTWLSVKASIGSMFDTGALAGSGAGFLGFINGLINQVAPIITGVIDKVAPVLATILPQIGNAVAAVVPVVSGLFAQLGPVIAQVIPVIMQVSGLWRDVLLGAFQQLLPVLPTIISAVGQLVTTLVGGLAPVFSALAPVISQVVTVVQGALVGAIGALVPILPPLVTAIAQVAQTLGGALLSVIQALAPVIPVLVGVIGQLVTIIQGALAGALQAIIPILPVIAQLLGQLATMFAGALSAVLQALLPILPPIVQAFAQIAQVLIGAVMSALRAILPVLPMVVGALLQLIQAAILPLLPVLPVLANLLSTIISALAPIIPVVVQVVALLIQLLVAAILPLMPIITLAANLFAMLVEVLATVIQIVVAVVGAFIGLVSTVLGAVIGFVSAVVSVFTGLWTAINGIFTAIFGVIRGVWDGVFGFVSGVVAKIAAAITGVFRGVGDAIGGVFSGAVNAVKGVINTIIGVLNGAIDFINGKLIDTANKVPFVNIPHIPHIPTLHEGGVFTSGSAAGEGLAVLRDNELVVTPEQRTVADSLLRSLIAGDLGNPAAAAAPAAPVQVTIPVTQLPGESGVALAARVSDRVVFNLNNGVTATVGGGAVP
jgi:phage-related protein